MSFANELKHELLENQIKKTCCKKAFLIGLLINTKRLGESDFSLEFSFKEACDAASSLLQSIYNCKPRYSITKKPGKEYHRLDFRSNSISRIFELIDNDPEISIAEAIPLNCPMCEQMFLRGAFIAIAKLNDPQKSLNLEFSLSKENLSRASKLYRFLSVAGFVPRITNRANSSGLYFKSNVMISDLLYFIGAVKLSFRLTEIAMENEERNDINRGVNCVTSNIKKAVNASRKQIVAIRSLIDSHRLDSLPEELQITARIRIENEEASLTELAALHNPPISKSGLNHRLEKLCREAEEIDN